MTAVPKKGEYFMVYAIRYSMKFLDDEKFFQNQPDAVACLEAERRRLALAEDDDMLQVQPIKVWTSYDPEKHYGHVSQMKVT